MNHPGKYAIGTSGYSFKDWVGPFYPSGTRSNQMLDQYVKHFQTVEVNFTYYRMPVARTLAAMESNTPSGFEFWIKANQQLTHERSLEPAGEFMYNLQPLRDAGKLAGVLMQFPQSFHRTVENRKYLASMIDRMSDDRLAVEFRHKSWQHEATYESLRKRSAILVVPDVPDIPDLFHCPPVATGDVGYLRLHSRNAKLWYAGAVERYDYCYSKDEMRDLLDGWSQVETAVGKVYAFFNNCHSAQAAQNAEAFRRILDTI